MLINICFGFMMLIASLIELPIAKPRMWQKHNVQLANFDKASYLVSLALRDGHIQTAKPKICDDYI
jgi:hypothetical protein